VTCDQKAADRSLVTGHRSPAPFFVGPFPYDHIANAAVDRVRFDRQRVPTV